MVILSTFSHRIKANFDVETSIQTLGYRCFVTSQKLDSIQIAFSQNVPQRPVVYPLCRLILNKEKELRFSHY